jgi:hypothetical protein
MPDDAGIQEMQSLDPGLRRLTAPSCWRKTTGR